MSGSERLSVVDKINSQGLDYRTVDGQQRATVSGGDVMKSFVIPRDADAPPPGDSRYEKAPGEEINNQSIIAMNIYNQSADEQRLASLESECTSLQQEIAGLIKKQQEDSQNQAKNYEW